MFSRWSYYLLHPLSTTKIMSSISSSTFLPPIAATALTAVLWGISALWLLQGLTWFFKWISNFSVPDPKHRHCSWSRPAFSLRSFFLLCYSESFSMMVVCCLLWRNGNLNAFPLSSPQRSSEVWWQWLGFGDLSVLNAVVLCNSLNLVG